MKVKRLLSSAISAVILTASIGIMPVGAEEGALNLSDYYETSFASGSTGEIKNAYDGDLTTVWQSNRNGKYYVSYQVFDAGEGMFFDLKSAKMTASDATSNLIYMGTNSDKILQEPAMLADDNVTDLRGGDDAAYQEFSKLYEAKILGSTAMNSSFEAENRLKGKYRYLIVAANPGGKAWATANIKEFAIYGEITDNGEMEGYPITNKEFAYSDKQYLTSAYCISTTGAGDQTNASLGGIPQVNVGASAKMVIESDMLQYAEGARVSYAQNGGTLEITISASDTPDGIGDEITKFDIIAFNDYNTRLSDTIALNRKTIGESKYLIVEISCTSTAYIDYVELLSSAKPFDRLKINSVFKKNGESILSAETGDTVTAEIKVDNSNFLPRTLELYIDSEKKDIKTVPANESVTFTQEITVGADVCNVTIKDVTNPDMTQTFDAGYLVIGDTVTNEMIYGTYKADDGSELIITKDSTVDAPNVTIAEKTYTAVKDGNSLMLKDGDTLYAAKDNAAADAGYLVCEVNTTNISIEKSTGGNPIIRKDWNDNPTFSGDPAATVVDTDGDGVDDTVYLIIGHDVSTTGGYNMPEWVSYSSKDMVNWTCHGVALYSRDVPWSNRRAYAWASQMIPHFDKTENKMKYYLYICPQEGSRHSIGVAVADKPEGPYVVPSYGTDEEGNPIYKSLIGHYLTTEDNMGHADIDPTVWIEEDENGEEHRYLMWGNTYNYICELNEDMISVKDLNGDGEITFGDDGDVKSNKFSYRKEGTKDDPMYPLESLTNLVYTEAPWLYRRQDENGKYTGKYYLFGAWGWHEAMAYATADNIWGPWTFGKVIMNPTATSNTNHPSVIDFKGKTYFIYHNGMLQWGDGGKRCICATELNFNENGGVEMMEELSIGLDGFTSRITTKDGKYLGHDHYVNPYVERVPGFDATAYPLSFDIKAYDTVNGTDTSQTASGSDTCWEIEAPYYVPEEENEDYYVSIQSANKPGLYITANNRGIQLAHDNTNKTLERHQTFKTVEALDGSDGISFESVAYPGKFLMMNEGTLTLSEPWLPKNCVFNVTNNAADNSGFTKCEAYADGDVIKYSLEYTLLQGANVYMALYDKDGTLLACDMNSKTGEFEIPSDAENGTKYTVKACMWNNMKPVCDAKIKEVIIIKD